VSDQLDDAAKKAEKDPKNPENKKDVDDAVEEANKFIDSVAGLLPSAPVRSDVDDIAKVIGQEEPEETQTVNQPSESQKLADMAKDGSQPVNPKAKDLAEALDKAGLTPKIF